MLNIIFLLRVILLLIFCILLSLLGVYDLLYALRLQKAKHTYALGNPPFTNTLICLGFCMTICSFVITLWTFLQVA